MRTESLPARALPLAIALVALACLPARPALAQAARAEWDGVERVIAFADVHGAHGELLTLLRESGVTDGNDRWAAGKAQVVSLGDLLDRGAESRKVMDLLMRLQLEAAQAGGGLQVVLGNHEALNLLGDLRYVDAAEMAAYTDLEPAGVRDAARTAWPGSCTAPCAPFETQFPPGWFGHRAAFAPDGRYGRWLLSLPVAVRINDALFVHGGLGPELQGLSLASLNLRYRTALTEYLGLASQLAQAGLLRAEDPFEDRSRLAAQRLAAAGTRTAAGQQELLRRFTDAEQHPLLSEDGPNWYRGDALCNEVSEADVLQPLLRQFGVARVVIGHTPTRNLRVVTRFDGKVVKLDTGMNRAVYRGRGSALILTAGATQVRYAGEAATSEPEAEGLFVAPSQVDDANVQAAMRDGEVSVTGPDRSRRDERDGDTRQPPDPGRLPGPVNRRRSPGNGGISTRSPAGAGRGSRDRRRGKCRDAPGLLQARPAKWVTQAAVQQQGLRGGGWCRAEPQFQLLYALDVLSGNEARTPESILHDANDWFVYGTTFARAFGTGSGLPAYLKARPPTPGAELRRRVAQLDEAGLAAAMEGYLDAPRRRAILKRRDVLLALPAADISPAGASR